MSPKKGSSLSIFAQFTEYNKKGELDVSKYLSLECYETWLSARKDYPKDPPHAFRKLLTGHVRGDHGLLPFPPDVEESLIKLLRKKKVWPCFVGTNDNIGCRGFQTLGYWEKTKAGATKLTQKGKHCKQPATKMESLSVDVVQRKRKIQVKDSKRQNLQSTTLANRENKSIVGQPVFNSNKDKTMLETQHMNEAFKCFILAYQAYICKDVSALIAKIYGDPNLSVLYEETCAGGKLKAYETYSDFVFVKELDKFFQNPGYVGTLIVNIFTLCVAQEDDNVKKLFNGSIMLKCVLSLLLDKKNSLLFIPDILKELFYRGEVWFRAKVKQIDNRKTVSLISHCFWSQQHMLCFEICEWNKTF